MIFIQVCAEESVTFVPKRLKWDKITIPQELFISNPKLPCNIAIRGISHIIETPDIRPLLQFSSFREPSCLSTTPYFQSTRSSISLIPSTNRDPHISERIDKTPIPKIIYNDTISYESSMSPTFLK